MTTTNVVFTLTGTATDNRGLLAVLVSGNGFTNRVATGGLGPDLTLVLDVPVATGRERQRHARRVRDRFERREDAFQQRVLQAYREATGPGVVHIDASQSKQAVQDAAWREILAATAHTTRGVR